MTFRPSVAVFDYGIGNLRSAQKALEFAGAKATLTSDKSILKEADGVVLPGVGAFGRCAEALKESDLFDLAASMAKTAALGGKPFLGICVGMQLLYSGSEESPLVDGLGVVSEEVKALEGDVKIPQMQWNKLKFNVSHPMFEGVEKDTWVYFVHSYSAPKTKESIAVCDYGIEVNSAIAINNLWATQFHPEKSGETGIAILRNFLFLLENVGS